METIDDMADDDGCFSPSNASPPDFDFNLPCRFFKSSFARSLSLNSSGNQCKSLDYDVRSYNSNSRSSGSNSNNNKLSYLKRETTAVLTQPPLPQRRYSQAGSFYQSNEANICEQKQVFADTLLAEDEEKPPALPARRPLSLHNSPLAQNSSVNECHRNAEQKFQQTVLTQFRQPAYKQSANNSNNNSVTPINNNNNNITSYNNKNYTDHVNGLPLSPQQQSHNFTATTSPNVSSSKSGSCNSSSVINKNKNNYRRNNNHNNSSNNNQIVWTNQEKNMKQDCNICNFNDADKGVDKPNSNYHEATELLAVNDCNNHFYNSHQMLHTMPIMTNHHCNQNQQKQMHHQHHHHQQQQQQQQQQQHQISSYEILNDNTANVEAVILQNQVDSLQWQLKQVETSCDMYRAVMEEVARFLERYQSQKQLQQQQQQYQKQQQQQQVTAQKQYNDNNKLEQIPRSKSLFQVYVAGGHEKSTNGNNALDEATTTAASYLRARSSTNLIDLKHQQSNASCKSKIKDDHIFETGLAPSQSYSTFKDFTWRRSPKKSDSRLSTAKDDAEEKLNQEAFRLLRTIQNLLNTSHLQPDLTHHHRNSLGPATALPTGRLSKSMSSASVVHLPVASLNIGANSAGVSTTSESSHASSPTTITANNAVSNNNLAPEMLFLRSANMRDSRLSLRSSTDSSVHSTSSAASSASSKVETDEEHPNILTHKQHHHLVGSSTEDESGFSSISSFPDIGAALSSTILSTTSSSSKSSSLVGKDLKMLEANEKDLQTTDSRNSTLKANIVGLPLNSSQDMSHRWDSPSKTYHNASNKFQRFSALANEDSNNVLWV